MLPNKIPYTKNVLPEISISFSCKVPKNKRTQIRNSQDAVNVFRQVWNTNTLEYKEQFYVLCLSRSNDILGYFLHSIGGLAGTTVDIKQILAIAIKTNAASVLISHNHPSGNTTPSVTDTAITSRIVRGAYLLDITVLDHLILTESSYYSFADEGKLPLGDTYENQKVEEYISYPKS